jgi:hypothetical protein
VARDGSEICISLGRKAYCAQNGAVRETKLELVFSRLEPYQDERGVQTRGPAGIHHGGERIRKTALTVFSSPLCFCIEKPPLYGWRRLGSWGFLQN